MSENSIWGTEEESSGKEQESSEKPKSTTFGVTEEESEPNHESEPDEPTKSNESDSSEKANVTDQSQFENLKETVVEQFDEETWQVTEAVLSAHAVLLLDDVQRCMGLIIEGPSSAGKTTVLQFMKELDEVYRSDDLTPASFVSHDPTKDEHQLEKIDLLPRIRHKTLINADMLGWFAGDRDRIRENMSKIARVMDGNGYKSDSGTQGSRGYEGDFRFTLLGATTPLKPRAWRVMGHTGNRLLIHEKSGTNDIEKAKHDVFDGSEYKSKVAECKKAVTEFIQCRWDDYGGYGSVAWESDIDEEIKDALGYLAKLIRYARVPSPDDQSEMEAPHRILNALYDLARGRALLRGREYLVMDDISVCARVALSTMPKKRRGIVRLVLASEATKITTENVASALDISRPTARDRMAMIDDLGMAEYCQPVGGESHWLQTKAKWWWPSELEFPDF